VRREKRRGAAFASPSQGLLYWATILAACSIGETVADLVSHDLGLGYVRASSLFVGGFVLLALAQRRTAVPTAARYWIAIVLMSTTGTALADLFTRTLGLGYAGTSLALTALFLLVIAGWPRLRRLRAVRRADAADPVLPHAHVRLEHTELPETDAGYWAAIMVASTLGTASSCCSPTASRDEHTRRRASIDAASAAHSSGVSQRASRSPARWRSGRARHVAASIRDETARSAANASCMRAATASDSTTRLHSAFQWNER
jgi:hypothetical protein